MGYSVAHA